MNDKKVFSNYFNESLILNNWFSNHNWMFSDETADDDEQEYRNEDQWRPDRWTIGWLLTDHHLNTSEDNLLIEFYGNERLRKQCIDVKTDHWNWNFRSDCDRELVDPWDHLSSTNGHVFAHKWILATTTTFCSDLSMKLDDICDDNWIGKSRCKPLEQSEDQIIGTLDFKGLRALESMT